MPAGKICFLKFCLFPAPRKRATRPRPTRAWAPPVVFITSLAILIALLAYMAACGKPGCNAMFGKRTAARQHVLNCGGNFTGVDDPRAAQYLALTTTFNLAMCPAPSCHKFYAVKADGTLWAHPCTSVPSSISPSAPSATCGSIPLTTTSVATEVAASKSSTKKRHNRQSSPQNSPSQSPASPVHKSPKKKRKQAVPVSKAVVRSSVPVPPPSAAPIPPSQPAEEKKDASGREEKKEAIDQPSPDPYAAPPVEPDPLDGDDPVLCFLCVELPPDDVRMRPCGHGDDYCSPCLLRTFVDSGSQCPTCRAEVSHYGAAVVVHKQQAVAEGYLGGDDAIALEAQQHADAEDVHMVDDEAAEAIRSVQAMIDADAVAPGAPIAVVIAPAPIVAGAIAPPPVAPLLVVVDPPNAVEVDLLAAAEKGKLLLSASKAAAAAIHLAGPGVIAANTCMTCSRTLPAGSPIIRPCDHQSICSPCLTDHLCKEATFFSDSDPRCPACLDDIVVISNYADPVKPAPKPHMQQSQAAKALHNSTVLSRSLRVRGVQQLPVPPNVDEENAPAAAPAEPDDVAPVSHLSAACDPEPGSDLDRVFNSHHIWSHVPESATPVWTSAATPFFTAYSQASLAQNQPEQLSAIRSLLCLPQIALIKKRSGSGKRASGSLRSSLNYVRKQLTESIAYGSGALAELSSKLLLSVIGRSGPPPAVDELLDQVEKEAKILASKVARANDKLTQGYISRACSELTSSAVMSVTPEVLESLKQLHPAAPVDDVLPPLPDNTPLIIFDKVKVARLVVLCSNGAAAGPSGWNSELLLPLIDDASCLEALTLLLQDIANDTLGEGARDLLLHSRLLAILKPDGGPRPIAIGEVFVKLSALYCLDISMEALKEVFGFSIQLGVACKGGSELAFHILQCMLESLPEGSVAFLGDRANAFNTMPRSEMLNALYAIPSLAPLFRICHFSYGRGASFLSVRLPDGTIVRLPSVSGSRQGCPLAALLFCLGTHKPYQSSIKDLPAVTARAICDDFTAVGPPSDIAKVITRQVLAQVNFNFSKSKILWPWKTPIPAELIVLFHNVHPDLEIVQGSKKLLGCMLGLDDEDKRLHVNSVVDKKMPLFDAIAHPQFPKQNRLTMYRGCVQPSLGYVCRTTAPSVVASAVGRFDDRLQQDVFTHTLATHSEELALTPPSDAVRYQMSIPVRKGGDGVRSATSISPHAHWGGCAVAASALAETCRLHPDLPYFVARNASYEDLRRLRVPVQASAAAGVPLAFLPPDVEDLKSGLFLLPPTPELIFPFYAQANLEDSFKLQKLTTFAAEEIFSDDMWLGASHHDKARMISLRGPAAGSFKLALPTTPALTISNLDFVTSRRFDFGLDPDAPRGLKSCLCGYDLTLTAGQHGYDKTHYMSCPKSKRTTITHRHDDEVQLIHTQTARATVRSEVEKRPDDFGPRKRPDLNVYFFAGLELLDVVIPHPATLSALKTMDLKPGAVSKIAAKRKKNHYKAVGKRLVAPIIPIVFESYGAMGPDVIRFNKRLAEAAAQNGVIPATLKAKNAFRTRLAQEQSVCLHRGNARVIHRFIEKARVLDVAADRLSRRQHALERVIGLRGGA
jgi:hypothetical protein